MSIVALERNGGFHQGDPCNFCGTPHADVAVGDCPGNPSAPDRQRFRRLVGSFKPVPGAWAGTSYGYHPHGVIRRNIIFTDHHNVNNYVDAAVILEPESGIVGAATGRNASVGGRQSDAVPRPKSGTTLLVYTNGRWVGEVGPWRRAVCEVLDELEKEIADLVAAEEAAKAEKRTTLEAAHAAQVEKARRLFPPAQQQIGR